MDPLALAKLYGNRALTNLRETFTDLTLQKGIRLVIIVFVYLMVRPYLMKWAGVNQMEQHQAEFDKDEAERERVAAMSPEEVRGLKVAAEIPGTDEDLEGETSATNWGTKARKRQRRVLRELVDAQEERLAETKEELEDEDIQEFLNQ